MKHLSLISTQDLEIIYCLSLSCRLSIIKEQNYPKILTSETYPTCQQCLSEVNNQTLCFEFQYNTFGEQNYLAACLVDAGI